MIPFNIAETMAVLTKCSFEENHRQPIFNLGGVPAIADLIQVDKSSLRNCFSEIKTHFLRQIERDVHGDIRLSSSASTSDVRRYAVIALTNLTFGNQSIKSYLCSSAGFVPAMVQQLGDASSPDALRKATAHLFRNLAWKADRPSKQARTVVRKKCIHRVVRLEKC